jgi:hypothetical protein
MVALDQPTLGGAIHCDDLEPFVELDQPRDPHRPECGHTIPV